MMPSNSYATKYGCEPACIACRLARKCVEVPVSQDPYDYEPPQESKTGRTRIEWVDRLAGKELECGHKVEIVPSVLLIIGDVWCITCESWQKLKKPKEPKKTENNDQPQLPDIPPF